MFDDHAGLNVVLISRDQQKLDDSARQISAKYPSVQVEVISANLNSSTSRCTSSQQRCASDSMHCD